jgi:acyl dehydratase
MVQIQTFAELRDQIGREIAVSDWLEVSQERIDTFADATGDYQWIHVDRQRAADSPFKTTIAHGFLTLSLVSTLFRATLELPPLCMAINYGLNRVRFIKPVPSGSRVRARISPVALEDIGEDVQVTWRIDVEREDITVSSASSASRAPCAVVEWIVRYYPAR